MTNPEELEEFLEYTASLLKEARSHFSKVSEGVVKEKLDDFNEYLEAHKLEMALDSLISAYDNSSANQSPRPLELMLAAAESMQLDEKADKFREQLAKKMERPA